MKHGNCLLLKWLTNVPVLMAGLVDLSIKAEITKCIFTTQYKRIPQFLLFFFFFFNFRGFFQISKCKFSWQFLKIHFEEQPNVALMYCIRDKEVVWLDKLPVTCLILANSSKGHDPTPFFS